MTGKVYSFGFDLDPSNVGKKILGGKGQGLAEMVAAGINVPPGFIFGTDLWREYRKDSAKAMEYVSGALDSIMPMLVKKFGYMPLVSVRSGAPVSLPGMMDTILNVGMNDANITEWEDRLGEECATESYERLKSMYKSVVGSRLPKAPKDQILGAVEAVFKSWDNERAKIYRKLNGVPEDLGTAVVIQAMVFGNFNDKSATGVLFTRNPYTGEDKVFGEWMPKAQGEDLVAGKANALPLESMPEWSKEVADKILYLANVLEQKYLDAQDVEFTVQNGEVFVLQTRAAKRTGAAAVKIAMDLLNEGLIDAPTAISRVSRVQYFAATRPMLRPDLAEAVKPIAVGVAASNGVAIGKVVYSSKAAVASKVPCILLAEETTPDDIAGMNAAVGILTSTGGATSHAAVVARGMNKVAVVGCTGLKKGADMWLAVDGKVEAPIPEGTMLTLDGATGKVWMGALEVINGSASAEVAAFRKLVLGSVNYMKLITSINDAGPGCYLLADALMFPEDLAKLPKTFNGVIDLTPMVELADPVDKGMLGIFGEAKKREDAFVEALLKRGIKASVVGVNEGNAEKLKAAHYDVIGKIESVESLLNAGPIAVEGKVRQNVSESIVDAILGLRREANRPIQFIKIKDVVDFDNVKPGEVLVMTDLEVIQSVL